MAIGAIRAGVGVLQRHRVLEITQIRPFEPSRRVAILAHLAKVGLRRRVAVRALELGLSLTCVAVMAPRLRMLALQLDGMGESSIQFYRGPGPPVAGRVCTKARIVVAKADLAVAGRTFVAGLKAMVGHKVGLQV
jgi:hypothetical protein